MVLCIVGVYGQYSTSASSRSEVSVRMVSLIQSIVVKLVLTCTSAQNEASNDLPPAKLGILQNEQTRNIPSPCFWLPQTAHSGWPIVDGQLQCSVMLDSFSLFALCSIPHLDSSTGSRLQGKKGPSRLTVHSARLSEGES